MRVSIRFNQTSEAISRVRPTHHQWLAGQKRCVRRTLRFYALALTIDDRGNPEEPRWVTLGMDFEGRLLVVVFTYRGEAIRLISARKATKRERDCYESKRTGI